jgi:hypothetical protein
MIVEYSHIDGTPYRSQQTSDCARVGVEGWAEVIARRDWIGSGGVHPPIFEPRMSCASQACVSLACRQSIPTAQSQFL